jgi:probable F420-dependent oxidoreductase
MEIGPTGIWSAQLRYGDPGEITESAAELEELGFSALWVPGGIGGELLSDCARLLAATARAVVATGILNIWMHDPGDVAADHHRLTSDYPGRFLLGLGVSHGPLLERLDRRYERPLEAMRVYLDRLDEAAPPVPAGERVLAALGPRMLAMARDRTAGAHPYLVTPDHTATARQVLGPGPLLAPEQKVVLEQDATRARALARAHLEVYLSLPNYTNNLRRSGFSDADIANGGSDRLVDAIVAWGEPEVAAERVRQHLDAGADHVCIQVLTDDRRSPPRDQWRRLAPALGGL